MDQQPGGNVGIGDSIVLIAAGKPYYSNDGIDDSTIDDHIAALLADRGEPPAHTSVGGFCVQLRGPYAVGGEEWTAAVGTDGQSIVSAYAFRTGETASRGARAVIDVLSSLAWPTSHE
jgi:hypothetical protein